MAKIAKTILDLQQRITARVLELIPSSRVVWRQGYESDGDWVVIVLDLDRSQFSQAKSAIREFRPEVEHLGIDVLPMVKDAETSRRYYPPATGGLLTSAWTRESRNEADAKVAVAAWVQAFSEMSCRDVSTIAEESLKALPCVWNSTLPWPTAHFHGSSGMRREEASQLFADFLKNVAQGLNSWTDDPGQQATLTMRSHLDAVHVAPRYACNKGAVPASIGGMTENEDLALAA